ALEHGGLEEMVTTGVAAYGVPGTSIYLGLGEQLTLEQMLYGLMLASGNDAAVAIAEHIGGSVDEFCAQMNARAAEIGATNTRFANPNGLPTANHYTTAHDLARIAARAMQYPKFREIVSTQRSTLPWEGRSYMRILKNKNKLLTTYEGATGIKTGFTRTAGRCLVFGAKRDGLELVGVVLHCGDWFDEAARLMDHCFDAYDWMELLENGEPLRQIAVQGGMCDTVQVALSGTLGAPISASEIPRLVLDMPDVLQAPFPAGAQVGWAHFYVGDTLLCTRPAYTMEAVQARHFSGALERMLLRWPLCAQGN
ncbi:MAG: D-alanyl-D-alanine carboxypeptidase family protein, partial [Clostridia bacterium]